MNTYAIIGTAILLVFYGSYYIKIFMQSKNGIKTYQLAKGSKHKKTFAIERVLKLITFLTAFVQFLSIVFMGELPALLHNDFIRYAGFIISSIGVAIFITAMVTMRDNWRVGIVETQKTRIITTGIYKYSRNPAFVGFDLFYIGIAVAFPNIFNTLLAFASILMLHLQILEEEKFLSLVFGTEYLAYKEKIGRYFGKR